MNTPKSTEERLNRILNAWRAQAADKSFGGMTLAQFEAEVEPSFTARRNLVTIDDQRAREANVRDDADAHSLDKADMVVAGVVGDPAFGADSSLYEGMGYTRKSERKSGLTRKASLPKPPPAPKP
jgi:hypothetical protein